LEAFAWPQLSTTFPTPWITLKNSLLFCEKYFSIAKNLLILTGLILKYHFISVNLPIENNFARFFA
jgi:hypothetical protein